MSRASCFEFIRGYGRRRRSEARIGRRSSETFVRIYDKAMEQGVEGSWVRVELEVKGKRAVALAGRIARDGSLAVVAGLLRGHLRFVVPSTSDTNCRRWAIAEWWGRFLAWAEVQRLAMEPRASMSVERSDGWARRQWAPSLAALVQVRGFQWVLDLAEDGERRWRPEHRAMVAAGLAA